MPFRNKRQSSLLYRTQTISPWAAMKLQIRERSWITASAGATCVLSVLAAVCACAQTVEAKQDCPSAPPAFPSMTFDEDNRYLADPECRAESLDRLKYIPLRREVEDYYISFGAWVRERGEYFSNPNWGSV